MVIFSFALSKVIWIGITVEAPCLGRYCIGARVPVTCLYARKTQLMMFNL